MCLLISTGLWGLVNNAGKLTVGMIEWQPLESFKEIVDVNLWGMMYVTKTFLPLIKRARGRVLNVGSILGESRVTRLAVNLNPRMMTL